MISVAYTRGTAGSCFSNELEREMAGNSRGVVLGSMGVAGLMGLAAILDLALGSPFGGQLVLDIMFILAAGLVVYMGIDCMKDMR